jgi:hypothetical protein
MRHDAAARLGASVTHRTLSRIVTALLMTVLTTSVCFAQSPYVGASLGADITRFDGVVGESSDGSGEALSWALKVGTPVVSHFGVELEFSRPQAISQDTSQPITYLPALANLGSAIGTVPDIAFPSFSVRTSQRNTTIATTAWVRQQVSPRFSMQYHGGIAFVRVTREFSYDFPTGFLSSIASSLLPRSSTTIEYNVGPIVGADARIGMTEHAWLVPGVRFEGLSGGWLVRPAVGLAWEF